MRSPSVVLTFGAALLALLSMLSSTPAPTRAASPSLNVAGNLAKGLTLTATVRSGPYFANEAMIVQVRVKNSTSRTITVQTPTSCIFSAQVDVVSKPVATGVQLPPASLCSNLPTSHTIAAGGAFSASTAAVIPQITGKTGQQFKARLHIYAHVTWIGGPKIANPNVLGGVVSIPVAALHSTGGGTPQQTLRISVTRAADSFTVHVGDGRGRPVTGAIGWYVVHAPDGDLAWGETSAGTIYCASGCASGTGKGVYSFTVMMMRDGYSLGALTVRYAAS